MTNPDSFEYPRAPPNSPVAPTITPTQQDPISLIFPSVTSLPDTDTTSDIDTDTDSTMSSSLTPLERSRQARGKDITEKPKASTSKGKKKSDANDKAADGRETKTSNEVFEEHERKHIAATILESTELLIFHAHSNNESIPQTRLRFEKMLIGMEESSDEWEEDLDEEEEVPAAGGQRAPKVPEKGEGSKKRAAR
ncbi:MAG: hypothetical protein M1812_004186 [Candelaria pacifica]|nr:MAG: hypothetical protein M1812_004186 [Candelaria pacifica]